MTDPVYRTVEPCPKQRPVGVFLEERECTTCEGVGFVVPPTITVSSLKEGILPGGSRMSMSTQRTLYATGSVLPQDDGTYVQGYTEENTDE